MKKKIIIAICGPSASGKDYLARVLCDNKTLGDVNKIVRDTTRPMRDGEEDGREYNFMSPQAFLENARNKKYIEYSKYRGWHYGASKDVVKEGINIGVFDYQGLEKLIYKGEYFVIPVYCKCSFKLRIKRSYNRERKFKFEYLRRAISDLRDYFKFKHTLLGLFPFYKILDCDNLYFKEQEAVIKIFVDFCLSCFDN